MRELLHGPTRFRERSARYFTVLRDAVTRDNLRTLRGTAAAFELFLLLYGVWSFFVFHSAVLSHLYLLFFVSNCVLLAFAFWGGRVGGHGFAAVQLGCTALVGEIMAFVICISVFPFPDRPSIFYAMAYTLMLALFRFRFWNSFLLFTSVTAVFLGLARHCKTPTAFSYDLVTAVTAWLLGFALYCIITDLHLRSGEARMELDRESRTDFLTGLPNRRELEEVFGRIYRRCAGIGAPVAAVMLDIDFFKLFNDTYGHTAGDRCLEELGRRLEGFVEETGFFAARYGGEEFAVLFSGCGGRRTAAYVQDLLERLRFQPEEGSAVTVSMGVAVELPSAGGSPQALLRRADEALYQAKENGRNRYVLIGGEIKEPLESVEQ